MRDSWLYSFYLISTVPEMLLRARMYSRYHVVVVSGAASDDG